MSIKISIIGAAGTLGSCAAFNIANQGLADELVLLDLNENLLKCHAMDIEQAVAGLNDVEVRAGVYEDLSGSDIVINSAGAPWRYIESRMELLQDSAPIVIETTKQIEIYCPDAVVITATNPVDPLNYFIHLISDLDVNKLLGYSINDSLRFRLLIARNKGAKASRVEGITIGEHGEHQVMIFSSVRINGNPVTFDEDSKKEIRQGVPKILNTFESLGTGRTSGWASAIGLASMVSALTGKSDQILPCSVILNGEYGFKDLSASMPVRLGPKGIEEIVELDLLPEEKDELNVALHFLEEACQSMTQFVNI